MKENGTVMKSFGELKVFMETDEKRNDVINVSKKEERIKKIEKKIIGGVYIMRTPFSMNGIVQERIRKNRPVVVIKKITNNGDHKSNNYLCLPLSTRVDKGIKLILGDVLETIPVHLMFTLFEEDLSNEVLHIIPDKYMSLINKAVNIYLDGELSELDKKEKLSNIPLYNEVNVERILKRIVKDVYHNYASYQEKRVQRIKNQEKRVQEMQYSDNEILVNNSQDLLTKINENENDYLLTKINENDYMEEIIKKIINPKYSQSFLNGVISMYEKNKTIPKLDYKEIMQFFGVARSTAYKYMHRLNIIRDELSKLNI